jgi:hypothetical protein
MDPPGISLLIARCMQPLAKNRFARVERFLPFCDIANLPTPQTKDFGMLQLPAPWSGAERPENRATRSSLSAGPLISTEKRPQAKPDDPIANAPKGCRAILIRFGLTSGVLLASVSALLIIAS